MLNELCFELVPQKNKGDRSGEQRLKLDCAVQHCHVVFTGQPGSVRRRFVQDQWGLLRSRKRGQHWPGTAPGERDTSERRENCP